MQTVRTDYLPQPQWSLLGRRVAAEEVNRHSGQGDADADQGVDGVAVKRHDHQEDGQKTEDDRVEQTELREKRGEAVQRNNVFYLQCNTMLTANTTEFFFKICLKGRSVGITFRGLFRSGCFHRRYSCPKIDRPTKNQ